MQNKNQCIVEIEFKEKESGAKGKIKIKGELCKKLKMGDFGDNEEQIRFD